MKVHWLLYQAQIKPQEREVWLSLAAMHMVAEFYKREPAVREAV